MWLGESELGEANKKTHQILFDSSENWYAIHPEVFEHESNLGFRLETFSGGFLENGARISEIQSQKSLSRFDCLTIFNGEIIFASEREFEVTFRSKHYRLERIPILRRIGDDLMRFFSCFTQFGIPVRDSA